LQTTVIVVKLTTNGVITIDAIKYVQDQMVHLNKTENALLQDIKENGENEEQEEDIGQQQEQKTHNEIF
jgi:hypothetical protein